MKPVKVLYDRNCDPTKAYLLDLSKNPIPVFDEKMAMVVHPDTPPEVVLAAKQALLGERAVSLLEQDVAVINAMLGVRP